MVGWPNSRREPQCGGWRGFPTVPLDPFRSSVNLIFTLGGKLSMGQEGQRWQPQGYATDAPFVPELGRPLLDLLNPQPGERVLDIGCGTGVLTSDLVTRGALVVGIDASPEMVAAALSRGLDARVVDAYRLSFSHEFDAAFSNAALHWMSRDPDAVLRGVHRALVPEGRFVGEMGGPGNIASIRTALHDVLRERGVDPAAVDPWFFPTAEDYGRRLGEAGFRIECLETFPRPTPLPTGMEGWLETFGGAFLQALTDRERRSAREEIIRRLRPELCDNTGLWTAPYVRLRFVVRARG